MPPLTLRKARPNVRLGEWVGELNTRSEGKDECPVPVPAIAVLLLLVLALMLMLMRPDDQLSSLLAPARLLSAVPGRLSRPWLLLLPLPLLPPVTEGEVL